MAEAPPEAVLAIVSVLLPTFDPLTIEDAAMVAMGAAAELVLLIATVRVAKLAA
jgi:hypothetical protein